jgi:hypothetical protein
MVSICRYIENTKIMKTIKWIPIASCYFALLMLSLPSFVFAQSDKALLQELSEENKKSIEALVLYPEDVRLAILETTKYPEILVKMQNLKAKTGAAFRTLIEDYPREEQTVFYDLTRYPGLIENIVRNRGDNRAVRDALEILPENQRDKAFRVVDWNMSVISKINDLNQTASRTFDALFAPYNATAQQAFRQLLDLPEVIDILNEDLRFTVMVGDLYKDDPAWVIRQMDSLNLVVARNQAQELEEWKNNISNNPDARAELQSAAQEYSTEYGYDDAYYNYPPDRQVVEHHYYYHHYPYWYGYPWWDPYPRWRPYPYWWDWGCNFYGPSVVIVYMPSYHFMHWYFRRPHHHYHYNHLSTVFVNHYYGHRSSGANISAGVREWRNSNRDLVSDEFLSDKTRLPERLKEYGKFEKEREDYNKARPGSETSPVEYLDKNIRKYPELEKSRKIAKIEIERENEQEIKKRSDWAPVKEPVRTTEPVRKPEQDIPKPPVRPAEKPGKPPVTKPETKAPSSEARDYHQQKWEEPKREVTRPAPTPKAPTPKVNPRPPQDKNVRTVPKNDKINKN